MPGKLVGVTQPRRVAAINLAARVSQECGEPLGELVGYRVRFDEKLSYRTKIKFVTDGMLLREAILDPHLKQYSVVILDEVHERSVNSDVLMALLKKICEQNKHFKLVVMSATLDLPKFMSYFNSTTAVTVEGRTHSIEVFNTMAPQVDYMSSSVKAVLQIAMFEEPGDVLVFLPG
jgi:HrpA-like RNA helicase